MTGLQCNTCKGVYLPIQADGTAYFHVCPPVVDPATGASVSLPNARNENPPLKAPQPPATLPVPAGATAVNIDAKGVITPV